MTPSIYRLYLLVMNILAIETSSPQGTVALQVDTNVYQLELGPQRQQIEQILPVIDTLLTKHKITAAQLNLLGFSAGPGSFTGIRVALGIIQGLALANELPVVPVSSLKILAQTAWRIYQYEDIFCCINAYMQEVYCAAYKLGENKLMQTVINDQLLTPHATKQWELQGYHGIGDAWCVYAQQLQQMPGIVIDETTIFPQAYDILGFANQTFQQGEAVEIDVALPKYLRGKQAWQKTS